MVWWLCPFSQPGLAEDTQAVAGEHLLYNQHTPVTSDCQTMLFITLSYEATSNIHPNFFFFLMVKEQFSNGTAN